MATQSASSFRKLASLPKILALTTLASVSAFTIWTQRCHFIEVENALGSVVDEVSLELYRANPNIALFDVCQRQVPRRFLKQELVHDAEKGGSKLIEAFCQGLFGGRDLDVDTLGRWLQISNSLLNVLNVGGQIVYTPQRLIQKAMSSKLAAEEVTTGCLWSRASLLDSTYSDGTMITGRFTVLRKTSTSILTTESQIAGDSPTIQIYIELGAVYDPEESHAQFYIKSVFWQVGAVKEKPIFGPVELALHRIYTKALIQDAVSKTLE